MSTLLQSSIEAIKQAYDKFTTWFKALTKKAVLNEEVEPMMNRDPQAELAKNNGLAYESNPDNNAAAAAREQKIALDAKMRNIAADLSDSLDKKMTILLVEKFPQKQVKEYKEQKKNLLDLLNDRLIKNNKDLRITYDKNNGPIGNFGTLCNNFEKAKTHETIKDSTTAVINFIDNVIKA